MLRSSSGYSPESDQETEDLLWIDLSSEVFKVGLYWTVNIRYIDLARAKSGALVNIYSLFKEIENRVMLSGEGKENGEKTTIGLIKFLFCQRVPDFCDGR